MDWVTTFTDFHPEVGLKRIKFIYSSLENESIQTDWKILEKEYTWHIFWDKRKEICGCHQKEGKWCKNMGGILERRLHDAGVTEAANINSEKWKTL